MSELFDNYHLLELLDGVDDFDDERDDLSLIFIWKKKDIEIQHYKSVP